MKPCVVRGELGRLLLLQRLKWGLVAWDFCDLDSYHLRFALPSWEKRNKDIGQLLFRWCRRRFSGRHVRFMLMRETTKTGSMRIVLGGMREELPL